MVMPGAAPRLEGGAATDQQPASALATRFARNYQARLRGQVGDAESAKADFALVGRGFNRRPKGGAVPPNTLI